MVSGLKIISNPLLSGGGLNFDKFPKTSSNKNGSFLNSL